MPMQQEVATHQALTPQHRRRRALAAALHNAQAQEGPLLPASNFLRSAASERAAPHQADPWRAQRAERRRQAE